MYKTKHKMCTAMVMFFCCKPTYACMNTVMASGTGFGD